MPPTPFIHHSPCGLRNKHNPNDQRNPYTKVRDAGSFFLDAKQPDYMYDGGSECQPHCNSTDNDGDPGEWGERVHIENMERRKEDFEERGYQFLVGLAKPY
jgi:hypothetical protein